MINHTAYKNIKDKYGELKIPYSIKLTALEWKIKRNIILSRESNTCEVCNGKCADDWILKYEHGYVKNVPATVEFLIEEKEHFDILGQLDFVYPTETIRLVEQKNILISNVHHKYYVIDKEPWEYPDEDLMLVCHNCHKKIHKTKEIKIYKDFGKKEGNVLKPCPKCEGTGYLPTYNYWQGGICFDCQGKRFLNW